MSALIKGKESAPTLVSGQVGTKIPTSSNGKDNGSGGDSGGKSQNVSIPVSKPMLEAPFANTETMIQDGSGLAISEAFFTDIKINNGEEIKCVQPPLFLIHGTADDFLKIDIHGQIVYDNYKGTYKEAHKITGAGHSTIETTMGFDNYSNAVRYFITQH